MYWGVEVGLKALITSALEGGECSDSRPGRLSSEERARGASRQKNG
jgi:hypothetical protein